MFSAASSRSSPRAPSAALSSARVLTIARYRQRAMNRRATRWVLIVTVTSAASRAFSSSCEHMFRMNTLVTPLANSPLGAFPVSTSASSSPSSPDASGAMHLYRL